MVKSYKKDGGLSRTDYIYDVMTTYKEFYKELLPEGIELAEDYPVAWNKEEFEKIPSFAGKLRYANAHLVKIASGSARTVFKIDDKKVLKIAKNKKGLAQNSVESEGYLQHYEVTARVYDKDQNNDFWLEMQLAKKLTRKRFEQITGIKLDRLDQYVRYHHGQNHPSQFTSRVKQDFSDIENNEFAIDVLGLMGDYDMPPGDLGRLSTYGEVVGEDGKPRVVLIDFGLTQSVWNDFYKVA